MNGRERILAMLDGRPVDHLPCMPITMQFAAGRIGALYRDYATNYRVLVEGQIRVAEEFDLDYVNTMSDPALEAADLGAAVVFEEDTVPALDGSDPLLADKATLGRLRPPDPTAGRMGSRVEAVALHRTRVGGDKLVEGWIEGPAAEAADLRGMNNLMVDLYDDMPFVQDLFAFVAEMEIAFARAQVQAGAEMIGIGDAAASLIGPRFYDNHVQPVEKQMVDAIHGMGARVRLHICGNTRRILTGIGDLGCDVVDLDFLTPVSEARELMSSQQVLLGNIDPVRVLRDGTPAGVRQAIAECHGQAGARYIVGPGCEVPRDTPLANLRELVEYARGHR